MSLILKDYWKQEKKSASVHQIPKRSLKWYIQKVNKEIPDFAAATDEQISSVLRNFVSYSTPKMIGTFWFN